MEKKYPHFSDAQHDASMPRAEAGRLGCGTDTGLLVDNRGLLIKGLRIASDLFFIGSIFHALARSFRKILFNSNIQLHENMNCCHLNHPLQYRMMSNGRRCLCLV